MGIKQEGLRRAALASALMSLEMATGLMGPSEELRAQGLLHAPSAQIAPIIAPITPITVHTVQKTLSPEEIKAAAQRIYAPAIDVIRFQKEATEQRIILADKTELRLVNLAPALGKWWLFEETLANGQKRSAHWEVPEKAPWGLDLAADGIYVVERRLGGPWRQKACGLEEAARSALFPPKKGAAFVPACSERFWIRSEQQGYKSHMELATDSLRKTGAAGEAVINFYKEVFPVEGETAVDAKIESLAGSAPMAPSSGPRPKDAHLKKSAIEWINSGNLGISVETRQKGAAPNGVWMKAEHAEGVFAMLTTPDSLSQEPLGEEDGASKIAYLMAIDMDKSRARYVPGSEHPDVKWSERSKFRGASKLAGPDGFADDEPLKRPGAVPPWDDEDLRVVFAGGFKRSHSAWKAGPLADRANGSHYGFAQNGVAFSALNEGVMTFFQRNNGPLELRLWEERDAANGFGDLWFGRQNGYPLVLNGKISETVSQQIGGNWSGNAQGQSLTMRSAMCLKKEEGKTWLVYAVFSAASPKAMAWTLKAAGCESAMQLDMNAPALTYAALVSKDKNGKRIAEPLMGSMDDKNTGAIGRFALASDSRDFFYIAKERFTSQLSAAPAPLVFAAPASTALGQPMHPKGAIGPK